MKYAYVGDHESVNLYGVIYPVGVYMEPPNEFVAKKMAGHFQFKAEIVGQSIDDAPVEKASSIPAVTPAKRGRKAK